MADMICLYGRRMIIINIRTYYLTALLLNTRQPSAFNLFTLPHCTLPVHSLQHSRAANTWKIIRIWLTLSTAWFWILSGRRFVSAVFFLFSFFSFSFFLFPFSFCPDIWDLPWLATILHLLPPWSGWFSSVRQSNRTWNTHQVGKHEPRRILRILLKASIPSSTDCPIISSCDSQDQPGSTWTKRLMKLKSMIA